MKISNAIAMAVLATTMVACGGGGGSSTPSQPAPPVVDDVKPVPVTTCEAWVNNGDGTESRFCKETVDGVTTRKWTETRDVEDTTPPAGGGNGGDTGNGDDNDDSDNGDQGGDTDGGDNDGDTDTDTSWTHSFNGYQFRTSCDLFGFCASPVDIYTFGYGDTAIGYYDEGEDHRNSVVNNLVDHELMALDQNINTLEVGQYSDFWEARGHEGIGLSVKYGGLLEHMMRNDGEFSIFVSASDDSPDRKPATLGQYTEIDGHLWKPAAILMAEIFEGSDTLFVTSMENSDVADCAAARTDSGINHCGEFDTYIAHTGVALDQTIYVSSTNYSQEGAGIHAGHILVVDADVVRRGYTSHAAPFAAALAGQVADHFGLTNPAEVKAKMFEFVVDGVLDHNAILAL